MCTLTWLASKAGYQVFFNRDERNSRKPAIHPCIYQQQGITYIAPIDADAGGTWISVNEYGTTLCLLNGYSTENSLENCQYESRGQLIKTLCHLDYADSIKTLTHMNLEKFNHFKVLVFDQSANCRLFTWDGHSLDTTNKPLAPVCSSSFAAKKVTISRTRQFQQFSNLTTDRLVDYHSSHYPERSAYSVCMHREDAKTVSFSHIQVKHDIVCFSYTNGSPCCTPLQKPLAIPIRQTI